VRLVVIPLLVVVGLLVIALVLPGRQDKSVALWGRRVLYQANFFARVALVVVGIAGIVWYVLLPLLGWRSIGP
jgi:hypothetical protein